MKEFMNHTQKMLSEMLDYEAGETSRDLSPYYKGMFDLCVAYQMGLENKNDGYNEVLILLGDEAERLRDERNLS